MTECMNNEGLGKRNYASNECSSGSNSNSNCTSGRNVSRIRGNSTAQQLKNRKHLSSQIVNQLSPRMTNNKNAVRTAATPAAEKHTSTANQKHSSPFYISASLFNNKRLKQLRCKWTEVLKVAAIRRKKTECRKKRLSTLKADITIDLLSDDEEEAVEAQQQMQEQHEDRQQETPPQGIVFDGSATLQISQVPNITLIPVHQIATNPSTQHKNKRKTRPTKCAPPPTCIESIILSDDDFENEVEAVKQQQNASTPHLSPQQADNRKTKPQRLDAQSFCNESTILTYDNHNVEASPQSQVPPPPPPNRTPTTFFAQVDEEVSVSLVPRSKASGTCSNPVNAEALFPMLPDETTVHTVIANRIYELSLSKLREGLATCGVPEFADQQQTSSTPRRKGNFAPPAATPPPAPVSLKLSSDLSISLISDDEEDDVEVMMGQRSPSLKIRTMNATIQEENLLESLPLQMTATGQNRQQPKKRKLG